MKLYDIVVVGAGPVGSITAQTAAELGVSVLLLEKDRDVGSPVRCAEGIGENAIKELIPMEDKWIAQIIKGARFTSPDGTVVDAYPKGERGYILHRKIFDMGLAQRAAEAGVDIWTKANVIGLLYDQGKISGVKVNHMGELKEIKCKLVIGADGVESRVGRWGGLTTAVPLKEVWPCVQMTLANIDIDAHLVEFRLGQNIAPGGYLWIFPKGPGVANVGLGITGVEAARKKPTIYLDTFVKERFPQASVLGFTTGCVTLSPTLKKTVADGLILVGDAARQINPLSGGGIVNGMIAGQIAGKVAAQAVLANDVSEIKLSIYSKEWYRVGGKNNERAYNIRKVVQKLSDADLNKMAKMMLDIPPDNRTGYQIFKKVLFKHPKLILEAAKVFSK